VNANADADEKANDDISDFGPEVPAQKSFWIWIKDKDQYLKKKLPETSVHRETKGIWNIDKERACERVLV
jgi:hypothetical protein